MQTEKNKLDKKKAYKKPRLRTIELAAEEVLAAGCKLTTGAPNNPTNPDGCIITFTCAAEGS